MVDVRRCRSFVCAIAFATLPGAVGPQGQTPAAAIVAGQVVDATSRRPLGGAVVTLTSAAAPATAVSPPQAAPARPRSVSAVANADGRFVFRDVPPGPYSLSSTFDNYAPGAFGRRRPGGPSSTFTVTDGARLTNVVLTLWRLATISGIVVDDRGEPVIGVYPTAMPREMNGGRLEIGFTGGRGSASDDRGYYRISGLMPGAYIVTVGNATESTAVASLDAFDEAVTSGTAAAIVREWPYSGVVRSTSSSAGLIIDGWKVSVPNSAVLPRPGDDSTLLVHPRIFHPGVLTASDATVLTLTPGDERTGIDLTLPQVRGVRVSGVLSGPSGPAGNQGLSLVPASTSDTFFDVPIAYATTDSAGRFSFFGVPTGAYLIDAYRVMPTAPTFAFIPAPAGAPQGGRVEMIPPPAMPFPSVFAEVPVSVGSAAVDGIAVALRPGARISGRVEFDGATPPAPAQIQRVFVSLKPLNGTLPNPSIQPLAGARVSASGTFQTAEYPAGRYHVEVTPPGPGWMVSTIRIAGVDVAGQAFSLGANDVDDVLVTFTDKAMALSGTVRPPDSGSDAESTILVVPTNLDNWIATGMSPRRTATGSVPASGVYQIPILLPGEYTIVALPPEVMVSMAPEFLRRAVAQGVRVTIAAGESKTQALTISRLK